MPSIPSQGGSHEKWVIFFAAKDGPEYFTGQLLESAGRRGEAADRLEEIYRKNARQMMQEGMDTAAIEAKIKR